ncbi:DUF4255 domain-containing protein [Yoonia sp. BS5-3]|uniref:DUF4255 domain-containing protein n=1 Tax=Yoonia phaeophyticola TaxID=3137369 RepID=A0ABZ2V1G4_9RHOB
MIDAALSLTAERLNGHLAGRFEAAEDLVVLAPLTDSDRKPSDISRNRLALFVTNIAEDPMPRQNRGRAASVMGRTADAPPLHLDIYAMLAANHDPNIYTEGLKMLSAALMFFQTYPVMTPQNTPQMPRDMQQLSFEISNLRPEEMGQMWGNLGGRYVPSVMFKIRTITLSSGAIKSIKPTIRKPSAGVAPARETTT